MRLNKTQKYVIVIVLIVISIVSYFVWKSHDNKKYISVIQNYIADFTGNNKEEMLQFKYNVETGENKIELINPIDEELIWENKVNKSHAKDNGRISIVGNTLAVGYFTYKSEGRKRKSGVEAFNKKTGEKIWEFSLVSFHERNLDYWLKSYKNNLFIFSNDSTFRNIFITCLNHKNGTKKWEIKVEKTYEIEPFFVNNKLIIKSRKSIYIIDTETGAHDIIFGNADFPFAINDSEFIFFRADSLYKYDTKQHISTFFKRIPDYKYKEEKLRKIAKYKDQILCIIEDNNKTTYLSSFTITKNDDFKKYFFDNEMSIQYIFYKYIIYNNPEASGFYNIKHRYIPFLVDKSIDKFNDIKQIIIFDLEEWKPIWKSKFFNISSTGLLTKDILYHKGFYTLILKFTIEDINMKPALLSFNAETAMFSRAIHFSPNSYAISNFSGNGPLYSDNYFYKAGGISVNWCVSFPSLNMIYSTDNDLKIIDAKQTIEELFGEMPWE